MSKKQIFCVYSCNQWRNKPMALLMATTSTRRVKMIISELIESGDAEYGYGPLKKISRKRRAKCFREDFSTMARDELNNRLKYVFFDYVYDGEEL